MKNYKSILILFVLLSNWTIAQEGTRDNEEIIIGKVMIIPFEPLMYMSQIDKKIHDETTWDFNHIREHFRRNLDFALKMELKPITSVISFYIDSVRMASDLEYLYESRTLSYELVEKAETSKKKRKAEPKQQNITNGQLTVSMNNENRFMTAHITNPTLLGDFHRKYRVDYFIFINEIDIIPDMNSYDFATDSYKRQIVVHYTILDKTQKLLSQGVAISTFSSRQNNPKEIVKTAFPDVVKHISNEFLTAVRPKDINTK